MHIGGHETDPLRNEIERLRYSNLPGHEVPNTHNSAMGMWNAIASTNIKSLAPQQGHAQVVAHNALTPVQVCLPNDLSSSIFNQNQTTEQRSTSPKYGRHLRPGGCKFIS